MGILDKLKRARDLARLRAQVKKSKSPTAYAALAERLVAFGDLDEALSVAEEGLSHHPSSERLELR